jgi:hypothetical protein
MNQLHVACFLSAFVCVAAQAQECSGGPGGGVDATGNQCSAPGQAVDSTLPVAVLARAAPAAVVPAAAHATPANQPVARAAVPVPTAASVGGSPDRFTVSARPPAEPVHTAKIESGEEAVCSGGVDGGTDATGNQCNPTAVAGGVVIVAGVHGR